MKHIHHNKDTTICTNSNHTYLHLKDMVHLFNGIIDYRKTNHLMYWINMQISNIKSNIDGIHHSMAKIYLNEYVQEHV